MEFYFDPNNTAWSVSESNTISLYSMKLLMINVKDSYRLIPINKNLRLPKNRFYLQKRFYNYHSMDRYHNCNPYKNYTNYNNHTLILFPLKYNIFYFPISNDSKK